MDYSPKETAEKLDIAPVTLRKWSTEFTSSLSSGASKALTTTGGSAQRRYSDTDIAILRRAKAMLATGLTYVQVKRELEGSRTQQEISAIQQEPTLTIEITRAASEIINTQRTTIVALQDQVVMLKREITRLEEANNHQRKRYLDIIKQLILRQNK